jgi:hypothetical protein
MLSELSENAVTSVEVEPISIKLPVSVFRSILYSVSLVELSFQDKSTWLVELNVAFNSEGAKGITPSSDIVHPTNKKTKDTNFTFLIIY